MALALGCVAVTAPIPPGEPFDPPAVYREWYDDLVTCVGPLSTWQRAPATFDRIRWFVVRGVAWAEGFACPPHGRCGGLWSPPHAISLGEPYVMTRELVEHEMLHDVLQDPTHDAPAWRTCVAEAP